MTEAHDNPLADATGGPPTAVTTRTPRGHVKAFAAGRECSSPECVTVLSRYNESGRCWVHGNDNQAPLRRP